MTDALGDTAPREPLPTGPGRFLTPRLILTVNFALAALLTALSLAGLVGVTDPSAYVGTVLLVVGILPSNLLRLGGLPQERRLRALARLRKPLGISAGVWFVVHSVVSVWEHFDFSVSLGPQFAGRGIVLGLVATLVFLLMLVTSTVRAQRALGANWKRLHRLVWFAVPLSLAHALVTGGWSRWPSSSTARSWRSPPSSTARCGGAAPAGRGPTWASSARERSSRS